MSKKTFVTRKFDELEGLYQGKFMGKYMMAKSQTEWFGDQKFRFYGFDNLNIIAYSRNWIKNSNGFKFLDMYDCKLITRNEIKSNDSTNDAKDDSKNKVYKYTFIDITDEMKDIGMLLFVKDIFATVQCFQYFSLSARNAKICLGKKGFKYPNTMEIQTIFDDIADLKYTDFAKYIDAGRFSFKDPEYDYNAMNDIINDYVSIWKDYIKNEFDNNADNLYKKYDINAVNKLHPWEEIVPIKPTIHHIEPPKRNVKPPKINAFNPYRSRRQPKKIVKQLSFAEWSRVKNSIDVFDDDSGWDNDTPLKKNHSSEVSAVNAGWGNLMTSHSDDADHADDGWGALKRNDYSVGDSDWDS